MLPEITKKEYSSLFDYKNNLDYKKLKSLCRKYKINFYKINRVRKEILIKNLYDKKLIELIQNERKLNLILDNAQIHKAEVTRIVADILNINLALSKIVMIILGLFYYWQVNIIICTI